MVALPAFRLGITLGLGRGGAHAGCNAFLESEKNPFYAGRIGSATYIVSCLEMALWSDKQAGNRVIQVEGEKQELGRKWD